MKQVKLVAITEPAEARDQRLFYKATFQDPSNPFAREVTRLFWQQKNAAGEPVWKGADPAKVKPFVGKNLPGYIASREVEAYEVTGTGGEARTATTYTTVITGEELESQVFKSLGHPLKKAEAVEATAPVAEEIAIA